MTPYAEYQVATAPTFLQGLKGQALNAAQGAFKDLLLGLTKAAVKQRFATTCAPDALPALAEDRGVDVGYDEPASQLVTRVLSAWAIHALDGRPAVFPLVLGIAGYCNVQVIESNRDGSLPWYGFDVWVVGPFRWNDHYLDDQTWGDPGVWNDGGIWPQEIPPTELAMIREVVRKCQGLHNRCRRIVVVHGGDFWDDADASAWSSSSSEAWLETITNFTPL